MRSINIKLFLVFTVFFVIPFIVFGVVSYANYFNIVSDQLERINTHTITRVTNEMDTLLSNMREMANGSELRDSIRDNKNNQQNSTESLLAYEKIIQALRNILIENNYLDSVYLYMGNGAFYYANYSDQIDLSYTPRNETWFNKIKNGEMDSLLFHVQIDLQSDNKTTAVLPYICAISPSDATQAADRDIVIFNISPKMVEKKFSEISHESGKLYITEDNGNTIFSDIPKQAIDVTAINDTPQDQVNFQRAAPGYMANIYNSSHLGWRIIGVVERGTISSATDTYPAFILIFLCLFVVLLIVITALISNELSKPIQKLEVMTKEIAAMNPDQQYNVNIPTKKGLLAEHFNNLYISLAKLVNQLNVSLDKRQEQERRILEAQINPHFIYNTLSSIRWQAVEDGNKKIENITIAIINLLKSSIKVGETYIHIREEIDQIKDYILIQKFKRGVDFAVYYDIDSSVLDFMTLKFILQPIVENAVFHGIRPNVKDSRIDISIKKVEAEIIYSVKDNGRGMTEKELAKLLQMRESPQSFHKGIGVMNVDERIKKYFGLNYGLDITSSYEKGTLVQLRIPTVRYEDVYNEKN